MTDPTPTVVLQTQVSVNDLIVYCSWCDGEMHEGDDCWVWPEPIGDGQLVAFRYVHPTNDCLDPLVAEASDD